MVNQRPDDIFTSVKKFWASLNSNGWATPVNFRQRQEPNSQPTLTASKRDPFQRSYDEIFAIQQNSSQGFRVIDIDPNLLPIPTAASRTFTNFSLNGYMTFTSTYGDAYGNTTFVEFVGGAVAGACNLSYAPYGSGVKVTIQVEIGVTVLSTIINAFSIDPNVGQYLAISVTSSFGLEVCNAAVSATPLLGGTPDSFPCQIEPSILNQLIGVEASLNNFGVVSPGWRTIQFDNIAGNWLKVEYLPPRMNSVACSAQNPNNYGLYQNPNVTDSEFSNMPAIKQPMLLQFENSTVTPLIAKHGDSFQLPFNSLFLTLKIARVGNFSTIGLPRIRLTIGYNTKIQSLDDRMLATQPAFYGFGNLNNQQFHPTPFSITTRDISGLAGGNVPYAQTTVGSPTYTKELIVNDNSGNMRNGGIYGWITAISWSVAVTPGATSADPNRVDFELGIGNLPFTTQFRRLFYTSGHVLQHVTATNQKIVLEKIISFPHPIRFSLKKLECLVLRLRTVSLDCNHIFGIEGYCMSNLSNSNQRGSYGQGVPYYPAWFATENPYPLD